MWKLSLNHLGQSSKLIAIKKSIQRMVLARK